jgi:hypothetical protein
MRRGFEKGPTSPSCIERISSTLYAQTRSASRAAACGRAVDPEPTGLLETFTAFGFGVLL